MTRDVSVHAPAPLDLQRCPLEGTQLIEASAGTGKTWAICALVLRLLVEKRLDIGQVLVVTFTKAAAAELRQRIRARLVVALAEWEAPGSQDDGFVTPWLARLKAGGAGDEVAQRLRAALQGFDDASVATIHGFCQRALGDAAFSAGMPLELEASTDDSLLRLEVVADFWRREVAGRALPTALAQHLLDGGDSPAAWSRLLQRCLARPLSALRWPAAIDDDEAGADIGSRLDELRALHSELRETWVRERDAITALLQAAQTSELNGSRVRPQAVPRGAAAWDDWLALADPLAALPRDESTQNAMRLYTARRLKEVTKAKGTTPRHAFFDTAQALLDGAEAARGALAIARLRLLRRLLATAPVALAQAKRRQRTVAFDDMLANLHARLHGDGGDALAQALRQRFPAALIDEFQDTDPLQWAIFRRVHGEAGLPLVLVGDPKQAIYSFRNADLATYLAARDSAAARHGLADNQRASEGLIHALNALYRGHALPFMQAGLDAPDAAHGAKPRPAFHDASEAPGDAAPPLRLWRLPRGDDGRPLPAADAKLAAAEATAGDIARLLGAAQRGAVTVADRPLQAADLAVLVRSHAQARLARQALARHGVGSAVVMQDSVFATDDAEALAHVLAAVLEPTREPLVKAALATVVLGLDAAALLALAADERAWVERVQRLAQWRALWQQRGIAAMLRRLMADEGVARRLLPRADGERRLTNLQHLAECLHAAAPAQGTPEALLRWLQAQRREALAGRAADEATQLRLDADRHLVQIVTIHRSKGLEYPLVWCPFLWCAGPKPRAERDGVAWRDADGEAWLDFRAGLDDDYPADTIAAAQRLDAAAEDLRLVYVALTRAVHRCTVVVGAWGSGAYRSAKPAARGALGWLAAGREADPAAWLAGDGKAGDKVLPDADALDAAWSVLAASAAPHAQLEPLPTGTAVAPLAADDGAVLAALPPPARLPLPWRIGSYSGLAHGARHELAAQDHDARQATEATEAAVADDGNAPPPAPPRPPAADDILAFPRGPAAGDCLHAVFESADFTDPSTWAPAIAEALRLHGPAMREARRGEAADATRWADQLQHLLADVLATPLPLPGPDRPGTPLRLDTLARRRRLTEMAFHLPAPSLGAEALSALLARHGYPAPRLGFHRLRGWLKGYIDLVLCHDGRWWLLDWKSNHLGDRPADYRRAALDAAMAREGYHLQHLLYSVALLRWLRLRVDPVDPQHHFGGVLYLFVRGVRPGWIDADGLPYGVWRHRPDDAATAALSALLDGDGLREEAA